MASWKSLALLAAVAAAPAAGARINIEDLHLFSTVDRAAVNVHSPAGSQLETGEAAALESANFCEDHCKALNGPIRDEDNKMRCKLVDKDCRCLGTTGCRCDYRVGGGCTGCRNEWASSHESFCAALKPGTLLEVGEAVVSQAANFCEEHCQALNGPIKNDDGSMRCKLVDKDCRCLGTTGCRCDSRVAGGRCTGCRTEWASSHASYCAALKPEMLLEMGEAAAAANPCEAHCQAQNGFILDENNAIKTCKIIGTGDEKECVCLGNVGCRCDTSVMAAAAGTAAGCTACTPVWAGVQAWGSSEPTYGACERSR